MAVGRSLVSRRRRADEEGEDEGEVLVGDSASEGTLLSDAEGDDEEEVSSVEEVRKSEANLKKAAQTNGKKAGKGKKAGDQPVFQAAADTEAMMGDLKLEDSKEEAVDFETMGEVPSPAGGANGRIERPGERQRREHDDYRKKREQDPAFIPNRGNFFMHDTRGVPGAQGSLAGRGGFAGRGRGRGGAAVAGPFSPTRQAARTDKTSEMPWKHDLHDSVNEEASRLAQQEARDRAEEARIFANPAATAQRSGPPPATSFSSTTLLGKTAVRIFLPGMKAPSITGNCPVKKYVRLPDHRPPLRRDKPVRVMVPGLGPKYIFPSTERSFIFIPRQMRPNQRGFASSNYSNYQRSNTGGYGYSSRRTSMYGGSGYSASIAASRRSSIARESTFSPVSFASGFPGQSRPNIRLPPGGHHYSNTTSPAGHMSGFHTPTGQVMHTYPLPQKPTFMGTPTATMHQPRPQKAISVTGIESPAAMQQARRPSEEQQQPFYSQLPLHMADHQQPSQPYQQQAFAPPQQQQLPPPYPPQYNPYSHQQQAPQSGTPLSGIPEHAIHAQSFQPPPMPPMYYQGYPPQQQPPPHPQDYYYPPPPQPQYYMPPPQPYMPSYDHVPAPQPPQHEQPPQHDQSAQQQSGMVAHESNGMVFYLPASEAPAASTEQPQYQPAETFVPQYALPGLLPPTPAPEGGSYYYSGENMMGGYGGQ